MFHSASSSTIRLLAPVAPLTVCPLFKLQALNIRCQAHSLYSSSLAPTAIYSCLCDIFLILQQMTRRGLAQILWKSRADQSTSVAITWRLFLSHAGSGHTCKSRVQGSSASFARGASYVNLLTLATTRPWISPMGTVP